MMNIYRVSVNKNNRYRGMAFVNAESYYQAIKIAICHFDDVLDAKVKSANEIQYQISKVVENSGAKKRGAIFYG